MLSVRSKVGCALLVAGWVAGGCSSSHEFDDKPSGAGTGPTAGTTATGGAKSGAGGDSSGGDSGRAGGRERGGETSSQGGDDLRGEAGEAGNPASPPQGGDGAGGSAGKGPEVCPAFSCCISGKTFEANAVSPLNACDVCKPAESASAWTVADGKVCETEQALAVHPKAASYKKESCAMMCSASVLPLTEKVSLSLTFGGTASNRTSKESFLELDFSNLIPAETLSVSHALLRLFAEPDAPTAESRSITIKRVGVAGNICSVLMPTSATRVLIECDVTAAVQSWLASTPASARGIKVSMSSATDSPLSVLTPVATDGTQRPVLLLDYSGKCAGDVCPKLVGD